ncbi:DUF3095 domain-containing protein [Dyadobacter pollutisoli]|uniref:DUF3095 domain-containing protein n=1 Tax=Dyadobacter pollutisoli TaxID=2910158 RepID=A0A9E8SNS0_9BACT|nr:DUF3095 domain-containing protein [Dyadobacter pollutisoli]WAC13981.1 DUF3095 domain-containing protein [Dyadobacter pollutisoli]
MIPESKSDQFYSRLPVNHIPLSDLLLEEHLFYHVPDNWHVIVTDIKNSTAAVQNGLHETVNLIATGSIVTVLNIAFKAGITIPFFFGGDGATFILPSSIIDLVMRGLLLYKNNTRDNFDLELRVGEVSVTDIYGEGHDLKITKLRASGTLSIPVVIGNGLNYAEKIIKGESYLLATLMAVGDELDLSGMQCRWDKIAPPENTQEVVTLLVVGTGKVKQQEAFSKVMRHLDDIYGTPEKRQPISVSKLRWKTTFNKMELEMLVRLGKINLLRVLGSWLTALTGYVYFQTSRGKSYLTHLVEMSDTLVMDGKINTVISGTEGQRLELQAVLDQLEESGEILYGLFVSGESVMSCYVRDLKDGHIHFVDGSEGGYTKAAGMLKLKLKK